MRVVGIGLVPGGLNQDEAFAGYEAYSILTTGKDSFSYPFPVYLNAWGSGMNALETYLMIPFVALFGLKVWAIRMPQVIMAVVSLFYFYKLSKRWFDESTSMWAIFLLAICPWHIMMSRWGLESNLAPAFLLMGFYYFVSAFERPRRLLLSALCYGLALYTYAVLWEVLPFVLIVLLAFALWQKRLKLDRYLLGFCVILGVLAMPLVLFLLINYGYLSEIVTPLFSVPQLVVARSGEISFANLFSNFKWLCRMILLQKDDYLHSSVDGFGIYYYISDVFLVIGLCVVIMRALQKDETSFYILTWVLAGISVGALISVNMNRINLLHIWNVLLIAIGVDSCVRFIKNRLPRFRALPCGSMVLVYGVLFILFCKVYFGPYNQALSKEFGKGLDGAVAYADTHADLVAFQKGIYYSTVMFLVKEDPEVYSQTVVYNNYPDAFLDVAMFDHYYFGINEIRADVKGAYIFACDEVNPAYMDLYTYQIFDHYICFLVE